MERGGTGEREEVGASKTNERRVTPSPSSPTSLTSHMLSCCSSYAISSLESILRIKKTRKEEGELPSKTLSPLILFSHQVIHRNRYVFSNQKNK